MERPRARAEGHSFEPGLEKARSRRFAPKSESGVESNSRARDNQVVRSEGKRLLMRVSYSLQLEKLARGRVSHE